MANFKPFNNYTFFLLDKLIKKYKIHDPFLDIGCGVGDLTLFLAKKNWSGIGTDGTSQVVKIAQRKLKGYKTVQIKRTLLNSDNKKFQSVFLWDVIEHIEDDGKFLNEVSKRLFKGGYLVISVPSNPREWSWDDEFYGHYRRYTKKEMSKILQKSGFLPIVYWEASYPFFWIIRKIYTIIIPPKISQFKDKQARTMLSSSEYSWGSGRVNTILDKTMFLWKFIYIIQYSLFRNKLNLGFQMVLVAKKK